MHRLNVDCLYESQACKLQLGPLLWWQDYLVKYVLLMATVACVEANLSRKISLSAVLGKIV